MHSIDLLTSLHYCFAFIWQSQDIVRFLRIKTWSCIQRISIGTNYRHWFLWLCFNQFGKSGSALNTHNQLSKGRVIWNHIFVLVSSPKINCKKPRPCPYIQILSRFYPDFILILSWFYPDFILILSWFYPDFILILS